MTRYSKARLPVTNGRSLQEFASARPVRHLDARFEMAALRKCCNLFQAQLNPYLSGKQVSGQVTRCLLMKYSSRK
jgi:hypothetical protein